MALAVAAASYSKVIHYRRAAILLAASTLVTNFAYYTAPTYVSTVTTVFDTVVWGGFVALYAHAIGSASGPTIRFTRTLFIVQTIYIAFLFAAAVTIVSPDLPWISDQNRVFMTGSNIAFLASVLCVLIPASLAAQANYTGVSVEERLRRWTSWMRRLIPARMLG